MWKSRHTAHRLVRAACLLAGWMLLSGCGDDNSTGMPIATPTPQTGGAGQELVVFSPVGGKLIYNSFELLMKASGLNYEVTIMEGVTTDLTVQGLKDGVFDMVFMGRLPQPYEGIEFIEFLRVDVGIYTHPNVGVDNLTTEQIGAIFSEEITNWAEVGGADQDIVLFLLPEFDSTTESLRTAALGDRPFGKSARTFSDEESVILSATRIAGGVGYATLATKNSLKLTGQSQAEEDFHLLSVNGMTYEDPDYPITMGVGFGYLAEQAEFLQPVFDWSAAFLNSSQGQMLLQLLEVDASLGK